MISEPERLQVLLAKAEYRDAELLARKLLHGNRNDASVWYALSRIFYCTGRYTDSLSHCQKAASLQPHWADPVYLAGLTCKALGDMKGAINAWKHALSLTPDHLHSNLQLASLFASTGSREHAIYYYRKALEIAPDNTTVLCNLGHLLHESGGYDEAIELYNEAIRLQPGTELFYINLAYTCQAKEAYPRALELYRTAKKMNPDSSAALSGEANILYRTGKTQSALELVEEGLSKHPTDPPLVTLYLNMAKVHCNYRYAITLGEKALREQGVGSSHRTQLLFSLASIHDIQGDYREAFTVCRQANDSVSSSYNADAQAGKVREVISFISPERYLSLEHSDLDTDQLVFIIGMPRSGTSLVEQILATHQDVFAAGETQRIHHLANALGESQEETGYPECLQYLGRRELTEHATRYLEYFQELSPRASKFTDKTPHNFLHLPLITRLFPNARIIHCRRHPLDTCLSCYFRQFSAGNDYSWNLENLARHYLDYLSLMENWARLGIPMLEISYEQLVDNQAEWSRQILEYCGLEWDEKCLEFHVTGREIPSASFDQVNRPMYRDSVFRWKNYEEQLEPARRVLAPHIARYERELTR